MKAILLFFIISGAAMATEEPKYTVSFKNDQYEVRNYGPVIVAETVVHSDFEGAGNQAFKILAGYIFGDNRAKSKIAMTAPVSQEAVSQKIAMTAPVTLAQAQSGFLVQFTMPEQYTLETLPEPNDSRVHLKQIPARKVAVYRYSGSWSESHYQEKLQEFKQALSKDQVQIVGEPVLARFNSPFMIWFLRRNEIWIETK